MTTRILLGDCRALLKTLPDESVHCCVTSPPYWGLRDYGTASWEGGDSECDHKKYHNDVSGSKLGPNGLQTQESVGGNTKGNHAYRDICGKCGAQRIDKQIGLESNPEQYVANLVEVFREVRRILRKDGTCWVVIGDSYNGAGPNRSSDKRLSGANTADGNRLWSGCKIKDLVGIPWRVAFALQADGWWLRQDIIWAKPNPMPESVTDRCTKSHEYVFLLAKAERYWYDAEAVKELSTFNSVDWNEDGTQKRESFKRGSGNAKNPNPGKEPFRAIAATRNRRSVWTVATQPYSGAHFATFPPALIEPMILAGCPAQCCPACGKGWKVIVERNRIMRNELSKDDPYYRPKRYNGAYTEIPGRGKDGRHGDSGLCKTKIIGHRPACTCPPTDPIPGTVLDPFAGSGTTGQVAERLGRHTILIELNPDYLPLADRRTAQAGLALGAA